MSVRQLHAAGLSKHNVLHRVRAGRLHRVHRGVYAVGHAGLPREGLWMAAVLTCGAPTATRARVREGGSVDGRGHGGAVAILDRWGAVLSHRGAAELWELLPPAEGPVDVSVPGDGGRARRRGIRVHRSLSLSPAEVTLQRGIPVTKPARTIADLRRAAASGRPGVVTARELRRAVRQAAVLGLPIEERDGRDRTRSDLERAFLRVCRRQGLPLPEVNVRVGAHLVDFLWREPMVAVETDGYRYHRGKQAFEDDRARDLDLRAHGCQVVRLSQRQVEEEPQRVAAVLRPLLARPGAAP